MDGPHKKPGPQWTPTAEHRQDKKKIRERRMRLTVSCTRNWYELTLGDNPYKERGAPPTYGQTSNTAVYKDSGAASNTAELGTQTPDTTADYRKAVIRESQEGKQGKCSQHAIADLDVQASPWIRRNVKFQGQESWMSFFSISGKCSFCAPSRVGVVLIPECVCSIF